MEEFCLSPSGNKIALYFMMVSKQAPKNKLISIIILNWNGKRWLKKCMDSLESQSFKNFEIILVDNNSTDNSVGFIKKNYPLVNLIQSKRNLGFAGGNNLGIKTARGEYILLLNNDTWVETNFLKNILTFYKRNKYDVISPIAMDYDSNFKKKYFSKIDPFGHSVFKYEEFGKNFYLTGVCLFFPKKLYLETGGFDDDFFMYCEDVDWFWRLNLLGKKFSYCPNIFLHHFQAGSTSQKRIKYKVFLWRNQNTLLMLLKNYAWYNLLWVLPFYFLQNIIEIFFFLLILKPKISLSYLAGWWFNLLNLRRTISKRRRVQKMRKISDFEIMGKMYLGFGKLRHLVISLSKND